MQHGCVSPFDVFLVTTSRKCKFVENYLCAELTFRYNDRVLEDNSLGAAAKTSAETPLTICEPKVINTSVNPSRSTLANTFGEVHRKLKVQSY